MNTNTSYNNHNNDCDKLDRKAKVTEYFTEFKKQYPQFFSNYNPPKAKNPFTNVNLSEKKMAKVAIDQLPKSVLCGTIFGDSSLNINRGYKNARVQNRHSTRQKEWFFWKWMVCLAEFNNGVTSVVFSNPDGFQTGSQEVLGKLKIASKANAKLTALHSIITVGGKKKIQRSWLNHMTDYFIMTIWLDDGSLFNGRQGRICLNSTPLNEQKVLVNYLKTVWHVDCYVAKTGKRMANGEESYMICISNQENLLKLLRIIAPIIPVREMLYKIQFVPFNNTDLLQRWASEVEQLVLPEFRQHIKEFYKLTLSVANSEEDIVQ